MRLYKAFRCSSCQHKFNAGFVDIEKQVCDNCIEENLDKVGKKYPYQDRLINEFPELFIK